MSQHVRLHVWLCHRASSDSQSPESLPALKVELIHGEDTHSFCHDLSNKSVTEWLDGKQIMRFENSAWLSNNVEGHGGR